MTRSEEWRGESQKEDSERDREAKKDLQQRHTHTHTHRNQIGPTKSETFAEEEEYQKGIQLKCTD